MQRQHDDAYPKLSCQWAGFQEEHLVALLTPHCSRAQTVASELRRPGMQSTAGSSNEEREHVQGIDLLMGGLHLALPEDGAPLTRQGCALMGLTVSTLQYTSILLQAAQDKL